MSRRQYYSGVAEWLGFVVFPLFVGAVVYGVAREEKPKVLDFLSTTNLSLYPLAKIPDWINYNLPDGLWAFAFCSAICIGSRGRGRQFRSAWIMISLVIALTLELSQLVRLSGTYDFIDAVFIVMGFVTSIFIFSLWAEKRVTN